MARRQGGTLSGFTPLSTPNAPTDLSVSTSIGSATVSFTAPTDTGDAAVTSFIVTAIDESTGESTGATGSASPITLSPGGGTFKIRAQAVNGFGPGRLSEFVAGQEVFSGAELYTWGSNFRGALGINESSGVRSSPVQIGALTTWSQANAGVRRSVAVKSSNSLWVWGEVRNGELGNSAPSVSLDVSSPVQVGALTVWSEAQTGQSSIVALRTNGTLWAWGNNANGRLGDGTVISRSSPVQIGALTGWAKISCGYASASAIRTNGTLWAWGFNSYGRLGLGDTAARSSPTQVGTLTNWATVAANFRSTVATTTGGELYAWGANNEGQLGQNNTTNTDSPVQVGALTNWSSASVAYSCVAVKTDNTLWAWGFNNAGQLGDNTIVNKSSPVQVGSLTNWASSSNTTQFSAATKTDGTLWLWGFNSFGQLGDNSVVSKSSPVQIGAETKWLQVSTGANTHTVSVFGAI